MKKRKFEIGDVIIENDQDVLCILCIIIGMDNFYYKVKWLRPTSVVRYRTKHFIETHFQKLKDLNGAI